MIGDGDASGLGDVPVHSYAELLAAAAPALRLARAGREGAGRRCVTRAAPPATRRASSTRTARRTCTRWRRSSNDASPAPTEADRALVDRADVPRQRVGHPVRRVAVRRVDADARPAHDTRRRCATSSRPSGPRWSRPSRRSGPASCSSATAPARPVLGADGHVRRRGDPALADGGVPAASTACGSSRAGG